MTKLGYPLLPVIVRAEPGRGTWMSESAKPSLAITTLVILIGLCLVAPICVIGFSTLSNGGLGAKQSNCGIVLPEQQSLPVSLLNGRTAANAIDDRRTDPVPTPSSSPGVSDEPAATFTRSGVVTVESGIAAQAEGRLPQSKTIDGTPGSAKAHRHHWKGTPASRRAEETAKGKTAHHHRAKTNSTANRTSHGQRRRAALSRPGSREDREDQEDCLSPLVGAERKQYSRGC